MVFKKGNLFWKFRKKTGFIKGNKNPKLSETRKRMFKEGLLNVSGENNGMYQNKSWCNGLTKYTDERLKKIGEKRKGFRWSKEIKRKISEAHKGKRLSEDHKNKIGEKSKGENNGNYGRKHTLKEIEKIRETRKNQKNCYTSSIETKIQDFLKQLGIEFFTHQYININHGYQCDILIPSMNLVIECDGNYWHKYPVGKEIDNIRTKELLEKGFKVLRLWEFEIKEMNINNFKKILEGKNVCVA